MMSRSQGRVVLLIGPSCAGKSTLTKAIQDAAPTPFLGLSLDGLFAGVPDRWGGQGIHTAEGFRYEWFTDARNPDGRARRIVCGDVGWRMLQGLHRAAAAYAAAGNDVVVDDMLLDERVLADWREALAATPTLIVRLTAPFDEFLRREAARTLHQTLGLVAGHFDLHERIPADLLIDTSVMTLEEAARRVLATVIPTAGHGALHRA
jgi:chloramphenicol 3-O phosphotransferase